MALYKAEEFLKLAWLGMVFSPRHIFIVSHHDSSYAFAPLLRRFCDAVDSMTSMPYFLPSTP
jgi:hypothetical protein